MAAAKLIPAVPTQRLIACFALAVSAISAQGPALVRLNVIARDAHGDPAPDLRVEDFSVTDKGKPQALRFFRRNPLPRTSALAPGEVANRTGSILDHTTAILLDLINGKQSVTPDARLRLGRSLSSARWEDPVMFCVLDDQGTLTREFFLSGKNPKQIEHALDDALKAAIHPHPPVMNPMDVWQATKGAIETLAGRLAAIPGGRDMVWITDRLPHPPGCTGDWVDCGGDTRNLISALGSSRIAVDPFTYSSNAALKTELDHVAGVSGGSSFSGVDVRSALKQVSRDATQNYTLGYEAPSENWDGAFHRIQVTCHRPGITIRARQGYYADPDKRTAEAKQQAAVLAAYLSSAGIPDIGLRVAAVPGAAKTLRLQTVINAADVFLRQGEGQFTGRLTILLSDTAASGPLGPPVVATFELHLTPEQRDVVLQTGILIAQSHPVPDSARKLVVVVIDQATGAAGSVTVPIPSS